MKFLHVYQIYYKRDQLVYLDYTPLENKECDAFFESSVIAKTLIPECEYYGVVSPEFRNKIDTSKRWGAKFISNTSEKNFTPDDFRKVLKENLPDIMSFQRHAPHDPIHMADRFHPNFSKYFKEIMHHIGKEPFIGHYEKVIYSNLFVAKRHIYLEFINEWLRPALNVMKEMPELWQNSNYPKPLPEHLQHSFGVSYYPYHAFLAERIISVFINQKDYKFLNY